MRIAYFVESLPPNTDGVSQTFINLIRTLESGNIDFRFYCPFRPGPDCPWSWRIRKVFSLPFPLYMDYRVSLPLIDSLSKDLREFGPDIIHVSSPTLLGISGQNHAMKLGIPAVASFHTDFVSYFRYYGIRPFEELGWRFLRWFYSRSALTYAPCRSTVEKLRSHGIERVELWGRGVDLKRFSPAYGNPALRESLGGPDIPVILFVGRLVREKDLEDLAQAAQLLRVWGNRFKLVFVGDGPMRRELSRRLPRAHFAGLQSGRFLSEWYASSDIFVYPSTTETFGNAVQEALASGLPAVGVREGGVVDLIRHGNNGLLATPNSPEDLAKKIQLLLKDQALREELGAHARESVAHKSWHAVNGSLIRSYEGVIRAFHSGGLCRTDESPLFMRDKHAA